MNKVSLNLNERTQSVPIFNTVNDLLSKYYESLPVDSEIEKYGLLHDTYFLIKDLFNIVGCKYDEETQLILANYIYRQKGSIKSIYELFRVLWGDYAGGISNSPGYNIRYKYSVKGYNDLYAYKNTGKTIDNLTDDVFPVLIHSTSFSPLELYYPLIIPKGSKVIPYITKNDINDFIVVEKTLDQRSLETTIESVDSIPEGILSKDSKEININIEAKKIVYKDNEEIEYIYLFNKSTDNARLTKRIKTNIEESTETFGDDDIFSSEKTSVEDENGKDNVKIVNIYKKGNNYKKEVIFNGNVTQTLFWTERTETRDNENKSISSLISLGYSLSGDTYTEVTTRTGGRSSNEALKSKNIQDGEEENIVSFELYDDGSIKEKSTTQILYDLEYKETETTVKDVNGNIVNTVIEKSVSKTPRTINRTYKIKPPQKKKLAVGLRQLFNVNNNRDIVSFYYESENPTFEEISFNGYYLDVEDNIPEDLRDSYIYKTDDLNKILNKKIDVNHNLGDIYVLIYSKITSEDSEESREAQKVFWKFNNEEESNEKIINIGDFNIKTLNAEDCQRSEIPLNNKDVDKKNESLAVKNFLRPHVEIKCLISSDNDTNSVDIFAGDISRKLLSFIKYTDARELDIDINFTGKDKELFVKNLEELVRDLLFVSKKGNNSYIVGSISDDGYGYYPAINIKINITTYNIDSDIRLKNNSEVRQINNIIPKKYISEGRLLWTSKY